MKSINNVELRLPKNTHEEVLFSKIMDWIDEMNYGKVTVEITIKAGKPTMLHRAMATESFSIYNNN